VWERIDDDAANPNKAGPHEDVQAFLFHGGNLYTATDGGLWRWNVKDQRWANLNTVGLATSQLWSIALDPTRPNHLLIGLQDNGAAVSRNGGAVWLTIKRGDGVKVGIDPRRDTYLAAGPRGFLLSAPSDED